jgi:glucose-6-phosphate isomerase
MHGKIINPGITFIEDQLKGKEISHIERRMKDLAGIFEDEVSYKSFDPETLVYEVDSYFPVKDGTPGGLFFGLTIIHPGKVGNEYFMTKGHFHEQSDRAEYYWGIKGTGMLIFMDHERNTWGEIMTPGSLHYIPSDVAHRVANTGNMPLAFGACWPSDAGHDYGTISDRGFSARLVDVDGAPTLK